MNVAIRVLCWGNVCDCEALYATFDVLPPPESSTAAAADAIDEAVRALQQLVCCGPSLQLGVLGKADPGAGVERIWAESDLVDQNVPAPTPQPQGPGSLTSPGPAPSSLGTPAFVQGRLAALLRGQWNGAEGVATLLLFGALGLMSCLCCACAVLGLALVFHLSAPRRGGGPGLMNNRDECVRLVEVGDGVGHSLLAETLD